MYYHHIIIVISITSTNGWLLCLLLLSVFTVCCLAWMFLQEKSLSVCFCIEMQFFFLFFFLNCYRELTPENKGFKKIRPETNTRHGKYFRDKKKKKNRRLHQRGTSIYFSQLQAWKKSQELLIYLMKKWTKLFYHMWTLPPNVEY